MHFLYALRSSLPKESKKLQQVCQLYRRAENEEGLFRQEGEQIIPINWKLMKEMVNMLWPICGGIIIFALGMFIFLKPDLVWKLTEEWKSYRADEPSEFYLKVTKIGGISFSLFGIIMIMLPFILE